MKKKCYACKKEFTKAQLNYCHFTPFYLDANSDYPDRLCNKCLEILNSNYRDTAQSIEDYYDDVIQKLKDKWIGECNVQH